VEHTSVAVGDAKPTWRELPGVDGKNHSLSDLKSKQVVVVAITCNHCPIANQYFERMNQFVEEYGGADGNVSLVAISVSAMETDKLPRMREMAERQRFKFSYLYDESQQIAWDLGASVTPEFFVLDRRRVLVYRGAWDDNINPAKVNVRHVEAAVAEALAGTAPAVAEAPARGCAIDYND
jgi:peroxiredoxin